MRLAVASKVVADLHVRKGGGERAHLSPLYSGAICLVIGFREPQYRPADLFPIPAPHSRRQHVEIYRNLYAAEF